MHPRWTASLSRSHCKENITKCHVYHTNRVGEAPLAQLRSAATPIGAHDLVIAATAVHPGYRVATRDRRSFSRVDGLAVEYP